MSEAVIGPAYDKCRARSSAITNCVVAPSYAMRQSSRVLDTDELLRLLEQKKIKNIEIARALGLPDSRIPEIRRRERKLSLDEGAKLVQAFALEQAQAIEAVPLAISRLIVRYIAQELGAAPGEAHLQELTEDLRAFSEFAADPKVRRSLDAAESFFQAMRLRRPKPGASAPRQTDPEREDRN